MRFSTCCLLTFFLANNQIFAFQSCAPLSLSKNMHLKTHLAVAAYEDGNNDRSGEFVRNTNKSTKKFYDRNYRRKPFSGTAVDASSYLKIRSILNCRDIQELIKLSRDYQDDIRDFHISHFWTKLSNCMKSNYEDRRKMEDYHEVILGPLIELTMEVCTDMIDPEKLAYITQALIGIYMNSYNPKKSIASSPIWSMIETNVLRAAEIDKAANKKGKKVEFISAGYSTNNSVEFSARSCATFVYAFSKIERNAPEFFNRMARKLTTFAAKESLQFREISNVLMAYADMGIHDKWIFDGLNKVAIKKVDSYRNPYELVQAVTAYSQMKHPAPEFFEAVAETIMKDNGYTLEKLGDRSMARLVYAYSKLGYYAPDLFHAVATRIQFSECDEAMVLMLTAAYKDMRDEYGDFLDALLYTSMSTMEDMDERELASAAFSYSTERTTPPEVFDKIAAAVKQRYEEKNAFFTSLEISKIITAFSNVRERNNDSNSYDIVFDIMSRLALDLIENDEFDPRDISYTVMSCASAGYSSPQLFDAFMPLIKEAANHNELADSNSLSIIAMAYATAKHPSASEFFDNLSDNFIQNVHDLNGKGISDLVWAYNYIQPSSTPEVFDAVSQVIRTKNYSLDLTSQGISRIAAAFVNANHHESREASTKELFDLLTYMIGKTIDTFEAQDVAFTLGAYATMAFNRKVEDPELFDAIAKRIREINIETFNANEISNTLWSYAKIGYPPDSKIFDIMSGAIIKKIDGFNHQRFLVNTLWAYATVGYTKVRPKVVDLIVQRATSMLESFSENNLITFLYSLAILNPSSPEVAIPFFQEIEKRSKNMSYSDMKKDLSQLHQASLWYSGERQQESLLSDELREKCRLAFIETPTSSSRLHKQIVSNVQELAEDWKVTEEEYVNEETGYSIDFLLKNKNEEIIAVEVDGPSHYNAFGDTLRYPTGATILKRRQLLGLTNEQLLSIPYWEWNKVKAQTEGEVLKRRIEKYLEFKTS